MQMGKGLLTSKTFWLNCVLGALQIADAAAGTGLIVQPLAASASA